MGKLAFAGLLSGLGQGLSNFGAELNRRREQALQQARDEAKEMRAAAQRQAERQEDRGWKKEDAAAEQANAIARIDRTGKVQGGLQDDRQTFEAGESAAERANRVALKKLDLSSSVTLENLRSNNNIREATALEQWKLNNKGVNIDRYVQKEDGTWVGLAMTKDGVKAIDTGIKGTLRADPASADPLGLEGTPPQSAAMAAPTQAPQNTFTAADKKNFQRIRGIVDRDNPKMSPDERFAKAKQEFARLYGKSLD